MHAARFLFALLILAETAAAQSAPPAIDLGTKVRVFAPGMFERPVTGPLMSITSDTVRVIVDRGRSVGVPATAIRWLDESKGKPETAWTVGGGVVALVLTSLYVKQKKTGELDDLGLIMVVPVGTLAGGLLGRVLAPERWVRHDYH